MMKENLLDPAALTLAVLGLLFAVLGLFVRTIRDRKLRETANRLAFAALDGRPEEARVEARTAGRALEPLLDAMNGNLSAPRRRPLLQDASIVGLLHAPLLLLFLYGVIALRATDQAERLPIASTLFFGMATAWPVALTSSVFAVMGARRTARAVRASCISVVAKAVRARVDAEHSENLLRGGIRDPRGE